MPKPDNVGVGTALLILDEERRVLLGKRKGAHRAGHWCPPGGWIDREDESTEDAAAREALEEADITILSCDALSWTTEDHPEIGVRTVTLYFMALPEEWTGTPKVMEPHKCEEWVWFPLHGLPDPLFPGVFNGITSAREVLRERGENV